MSPQGGRCPSKAWLSSGQRYLGIDPVLTCGLLDATIVLDLREGGRREGEGGIVLKETTHEIDT